MNQDIIQVISYYLDIDENYRLKNILNLNINLYFKYVQVPIGNEKSYLEYIKKYKYYKKSDVDWASFAGFIEVFKKLSKKEEIGIITFQCAIDNQKMEMVKYLNENYDIFNMPLSSYCIDDHVVLVSKYVFAKLAIENRDLEMLEYLVENKYPVSRYAIEHAVKHEYTEIIDYLHKTKYYYNICTCSKKILVGSILALIYLGYKVLF